jgi:MoaA/NifB/PqqE/SkfB family radical SAM enzyme
MANEGIKETTRLRPPLMLSLEPIHACNLRCKMCHVPNERLTGQKINIQPLLASLKRLAGSTRWLQVGSTHEPTTHPGFPDIVLAASEMGMLIDVTTNGTLLTPRLYDKIAGCKFN